MKNTTPLALLCSLVIGCSPGFVSGCSQAGDKRVRRDIPYTEKKAFCFDYSKSLMAVSMHMFQRDFNKCMDNAEKLILQHDKDVKESFEALGNMFEAERQESIKQDAIRQKKAEDELRRKEELFNQFD